LQILSFGLIRVYYYLRGDHLNARKYPFLFIESWSKWPDAAKERPITIINESLKRVKVCVYHRADYACWVPVGGLTGGMYELERGEELVVSPHWPSSSFRVKAFAHGVIDFQLASHPCMIRGRKYSFIDVGKPITLLATGASPAVSIRTTSFDAPSSSSSSSSSEEEVAFTVPRSHSSGGLRRVTSSKANLSALGSAPGSPQGDALMTPTTSRRKLFKQHILMGDYDMSKCVGILNESTSEIRVSFFSIEATSFMIPLDGFTVKDAFDNQSEREGKFSIARFAWKVFAYSGGKPKFCMRVKGGESSALLEVAYCTVLLGEALVVRDPIVSQ
jgi:hypothetical protein